MGRAPCCDKANVKRGPWSPEEDAKLKSYIQQNGTGGNWIALPQKIGLKRCGKSCRLRWLNYLRPNIKHGGFSEEEDDIICSLYISIGSRWSIIAAQLPGRTDNDIKNYWNTRLKKKLIGKQRKVQQARRSEMKTENESFNILNPGTGGGFIINNQAQPYWPDLSSTPLLPNPHDNDNSQALKDQASIRNDFEYPIGDISCAHQMYHHDTSFNMLSTSSHTHHEFDAANYDGTTGEITHFEGIENLQVELNKLIYSNAQSDLCGDFYGWDHMMVNGSTLTSSTSADTASFGEINSSNYFVCPPMVSDSENYQTDIIMPPAHQDSSAFEDHYSSYFGQK